ncbi:unnamed protein product [Clavelina lepadiformis]|uniref:Uncharacterized protein n=1 Tax=Clavelina lepadiformis TaxID=159417 RepID=A0ABP0FXK7_CLALP
MTNNHYLTDHTNRIPISQPDQFHTNGPHMCARRQIRRLSHTLSVAHLKSHVAQQTCTEAEVECTSVMVILVRQSTPIQIVGTSRSFMANSSLAPGPSVDLSGASRTR